MLIYGNAQYKRNLRRSLRINLCKPSVNLSHSMAESNIIKASFIICTTDLSFDIDTVCNGIVNGVSQFVVNGRVYNTFDVC